MFISLVEIQKFLNITHMSDMLWSVNLVFTLCMHFLIFRPLLPRMRFSSVTFSLLKYPLDPRLGGQIDRNLRKVQNISLYLVLGDSSDNTWDKRLHTTFSIYVRPVN